MRGELLESSGSITIFAGSSPHAWGTELHLGLANLINRFIPTCVGNWHERIFKKWGAAVHPHMRGELFASGGGCKAF